MKVWIKGKLVENGVSQEDLPVPTAEEIKLTATRKLKKVRVKALSEVTHTFEDTSVIQVRESDVAIIKEAIAEGIPTDWVMLDNSIRLTTPEELTGALMAGKPQIRAIWKTYTDALKAL